MDAISKLFDDKLTTFRQQIMADIDGKIQQMVAKNTQNIAANATTLEGTTIEAMQQQIKTLEEGMVARENKIDDLKNRSMRTNIVVKGIPESDDEKKNWEVTKRKVSEHLATLSNQTVNDIYYKIDRCHRGGGDDDGESEGNNPKHIYANLYSSCDAAYYVSLSTKRCVKNKTQNKNNNVRVDHQYSPKVQARRNAAMIYRRQLLTEQTIAQGRLVYPAKLLGKKDHKQKNWELIKAF